MAGLFGPSAQDLERLRAAVESLGTTGVPGLAAALSWRERKAEKLLAHELARPGTPLVYDPGRRVVRWARPAPAPAPAASRPAEAAPPPLPAAVASPAPAPTRTPAGLKTLCPTCHVPLLATGSASLLVCPQCGRLSSARVAAAGDPVVRPRAEPAVTTAAPGGIATTLSDRRTQELFAAWVTSSPISCPKCRTELRHRGVGEYACPGCGQIVSFPRAPEAAPALPAT
jgi:predicted RNA-binding Zn-ribbon protein involved in translation (DUF1610 family)